jgi:hypothetical protein
MQINIVCTSDQPSWDIARSILLAYCSVLVKKVCKIPNVFVRLLKKVVGGRAWLDPKRETPWALGYPEGKCRLWWPKCNQMRSKGWSVGVPKPWWCPYTLKPAQDSKYRPSVNVTKKCINRYKKPVNKAIYLHKIIAIFKDNIKASLETLITLVEMEKISSTT